MEASSSHNLVISQVRESFYKERCPTVGHLVYLFFFLFGLVFKASRRPEKKVRPCSDINQGVNLEVYHGRVCVLILLKCKSSIFFPVFLDTVFHIRAANQTNEDSVAN